MAGSERYIQLPPILSTENSFNEDVPRNHKATPKHTSLLKKALQVGSSDSDQGSVDSNGSLPKIMSGSDGEDDGTAGRFAALKTDSVDLHNKHAKNSKNGKKERASSAGKKKKSKARDLSSSSTVDIEATTNKEEESKSTYIKPYNFDYWIRALDTNLAVYYYNSKSGESTWLAPCTVCYKNGERWCMQCNLSFCEKHYLKKHKYLDDAEEHTWSNQEKDTTREELKDLTQEEYCIECNLKVANRVCKECWDAYCAPCFAIVHHVGHLKTHTALSYARAHQDWYTVRRYDQPVNGNGEANSSSGGEAPGGESAAAVAAAAAQNIRSLSSSFIATGISERVVSNTAESASSTVVNNASKIPGVLEFYRHGTTGETTYEKPVELMNDLERVLHENFITHQAAAAKYVQEVEALQFEVAKLQYERDSLLVENAQLAQGHVPNGAAVNTSNNNNNNSKKKGGFFGSRKPANNNESNKSDPASSTSTSALVLQNLIEGETDDYKQKLLHPNDRKRGEARANFMKDMLQSPLPK